jgi:hemerythrin-like domain-containing protein
MTQFAVLLAKLNELYRNHIATEDHELFPIASNALDASDREALGSEMAARGGLNGASQASDLVQVL